MTDRTKEDILESIRIDKVTSSFSLEGRSPKGIKTSSFLSYTAKCSTQDGWTRDEARFVESSLAQQVVEDLYTDAFVRQQITKEHRTMVLNKVKPMYEHLQKTRADTATGEDNG